MQNLWLLEVFNMILFYSQHKYKKLISYNIYFIFIDEKVKIYFSNSL